MSEDLKILVHEVGTSGGWTSPEISTYDNEAHLQKLLVDDPGRVPGVAHEAKAVAELSTSGGSIDVTIIEPNGALTVVECKLASNSERRRMIIGQVIDYAAAIWMDGEESFVSAWQARSGSDPSEFLTSDAFSDLKRNIADARIHLCLAVDSIDDDLRRLVEYLNRVTVDHVRVTALQLGYARHGDLEILIPLTFGGEIAAAKRRASGGGGGDPDADALISLMDDLAAKLGVKVELAPTGKRYRGPGQSYIGVYRTTRGIEFSLKLLRAAGYRPVAEDLIAKMQDWIGGPLQGTGDYPAFRCARVIDSWERVATDIIEPFLTAGRASPTASP